MSYKEPELLSMAWPETPLGKRACNTLCRTGYETIAEVLDFYQRCHEKQEVPYMNGGFGPRCDEVTREVFKQIGIDLPDVDFMRWKRRWSGWK